ncbi:SIS domain-containing protein [Ktedonospora formicarum]|uniref:Glucosamine--fructose-6-phosphate aminotransferase n=1 Tax=Ktedonospora formicarum TaxID=2778364 RepID=A0A8J3MR68_9CHLR|nr:SIS domain-containing protein [Ktedonospora formicarum]GHO43348.1 glucosamine--fructose-6-phosphate aminotransferase [Ktedonospora formicarum]
MSSLLEQEIYSQPEVIARLLDQETRHIEEIVNKLPPFDYVLIAARGSSDHAATYAKYAWPIMAGYPIALAAPSLHTLYHKAPRMNGALVVGISQSGQSPDIVAVLEEGKRQGRPTIAITNDGTSPLAAAADHVVELHAERERSVAATKTYTAQLAAMMIFAAALSGEKQRLAEIQRLPDAMAQTLEGAATLTQRTERYRYMEECVVIGRGYNYATAFELGLKLKELTYVMASSYSSADFRHGPIATIDSGMPVFLVAPQGATYADMLELAKDLKKREAELLVISEEQQILDLATTQLSLPAAIPEWLNPITAILPGQVFALHLTLAKGLNPDVPRGLNKVTLTL